MVINYLDRYFEYSVPFLYQYNSSIDKIREKALNGIIRNNFCAAVISNCGSFYGFRLHFIEKLSKYKKVDMGGNCKNNINNLKKLENNTNEKKFIKVFQTGGWNKTWDIIWFLDKIDDEYIIEFNETDPDYLIYNVFGEYNMDLNPNFQNSIKIAYYTENIMVDINYADYIIGN